MSRLPSYLRAFALGLSFFLLSCSNVFAHCFVGARFFPATLAIDDPCVADELSLPTVGWSKTGDIPPATEWDISGEISKRITETSAFRSARVGRKSEGGQPHPGGVRGP